MARSQVQQRKPRDGSNGAYEEQAAPPESPAEVAGDGSAATNGHGEDQFGGEETVEVADQERPVDEVSTAPGAAPIEVQSPVDIDPDETAEWLESLRYVLESKGPDRVSY